MDLVRVYEEVEETLEMSDVEIETPFTTPGKRYMRNAKAMSATPADVKEYPDKYVFVLDMPGVKATDIRVSVGENRVLYVNAKRKREEEEEDKEKEKETTTSSDANVKYLSMERRMGKFMKRFVLPDNANIDSISAVYKDGVLTVTVEKKPPPEPKKSKLIQVKVA